MQHEQKMKEMEMQQAQQQKQMEIDAKAMENEKDRRKDLLVAEIKAAGYGAMQDIDKNLQSDFRDTMDDIRKRQEFQDTMSFDQTKLNSNVQHQQEKLNIEREKINTQRDIKQMDVEIARTNKNKYDAPKKDEKKKKS